MRRGMVWRVATAALFSAAMAACGDSFGPDIGIIGNWTGSASQSGNHYTFQMHITGLVGGDITGTGSVAGGSLGTAVTLVGTFVSGNMNVQLASTSFLVATFTATAKGKNTLEGEMNGSGFNHMAIKVQRN